MNRQPDAGSSSSEETANKQTVSVQGVGAILLAALMIGAMSVCVRVASREMAVPQIAFFRFVGAFLILLAIGRGRQLQSFPHRMPMLLLRASLGTGAICLYFLGIQGAGAGLAAMLHCTYPVYTALFAGLFLGEQFRGRVAIALLLSLSGAFIVLGPAAELGKATLIGALCAVAGSVLSGGAVTAARHLRTTESALIVTTFFMAIGMVLMSPSLLTGLPDFTPTLALALTGTIVTAVGGQLFLHQGLGSTTATLGSLAAATTVISTSLLEAAFLGTTLTGGMLVGGAILLTAVAVAAMGGEIRGYRHDPGVPLS